MNFFSSHRHATVLTGVLIATSLYAGMTFAQSLNIPTNLSNAVITIQKIILSTNGTSTTAPGVGQSKLELDGSNGNITTIGNISSSGNLSVGGPLITLLSHKCTTSSGCILKIDQNGNISVTNSLSGLSLGGSGNEDIWDFTKNSNTALTSTGDIYLGQPDINDTNKDSIKVRIGVKDDDQISPGNQLVVRDGIQTRSNLDITTPLTTALETQAIQNHTNQIIYSTIENQTGTNALIIASQIKTGASNSTKESTILLSSKDPGIVDTKVGINLDPNTKPTATLEVNGTTKADAYYYSSDRRYKSEITPLSSALSNILKLNGYSYYNNLLKSYSIGVIAQEVEEVFPTLVHTNADGYKSVEYGNLVAPLIEAIKELANSVDHLNKKITNLYNQYLSQQAKIDALEARLSILEKKVK